MATEEEQKAALAEIQTKVAAARALVKECEAIADKNGVSFGFSVGFGSGEYLPRKTQEQKDAEKAAAGADGDWYDSYENEGWTSSSDRC